MGDFWKNAKVRATLLAVLCAGVAAVFRYLDMGDLATLMLTTAGGLVGKEYLLGSNHHVVDSQTPEVPRYQRHD